MSSRASSSSSAGSLPQHNKSHSTSAAVTAVTSTTGAAADSRKHFKGCEAGRAEKLAPSHLAEGQKARHHLQRQRLDRCQPEDEVAAFYSRVGQWLRGDVPKSEAAFAYFRCRCQPGFVAVGPTPGGAPPLSWGEWEATPLSTHHKEFLDNLFERHGVHAAGVVKFAVSNFELVSSSPCTSGADTERNDNNEDSAASRNGSSSSGSSGGTSDGTLRNTSSSGGAFLATCTYLLHQQTDKGIFRKRATCTFRHHPDSSLSSISSHSSSSQTSSSGGTSSTSTAQETDRWILLHEAWIDNPAMIKLEDDMVERRVQHSREIVRRTARALKREGLTLAALRFRSGDGDKEGRHEVVKGSLRSRGIVGGNSDDSGGDGSEDVDSMHEVDTDVDTSEGELDFVDDNVRGDIDVLAMGTMSNSWLVRYERIREEIERRTALVDPLHFVRAYTRHLVLLVAHFRQIPVMQMFRYPGALLPNTWNRVCS